MKKNIALLFFLSFYFSGFSQQKNIEQGYLEYKVKYFAESFLDLPPPPPPPPPGMDVVSADNGSGPSPDEGYEIKIWFNPGFEKAVNMVYGRSTYLFNTKTKTTITLKEISGIKRGTIASPEEEETVNRYLDSLYGKRKQAKNENPTVVYIDEMKKISGYDCKKAFLISENQNTKKDTITVWYYSGYRLSNNFIFYTDKPDHRSKLANLNFINGLPVLISLNLTTKTRLEIELIKIDPDKKITDKDFMVPKDFELKLIKEIYGLK